MTSLRARQVVTGAKSQRILANFGRGARGSMLRFTQDCLTAFAVVGDR